MPGHRKRQDKEPDPSWKGKHRCYDVRDSDIYRACQHCDMTDKEYITEYDQLYDSMAKCKRGVMWKPTTMSFWINDIENIRRMEKKLKSGTWKNGKPKPVQILYPKKREGMAIPFKDRIYQRSINDNVLYPSTTRSFTIRNMACQTGRGPDKARTALKRMLWKFYRNNGRNGYILQLDIKGYYPNMRHDVVKEAFSKYLDKEVLQMVTNVLEDQYHGEIGYFPGSQMVQIAGITVLSDIDHYIAEKLHCKSLLYMDDLLIIGENRDELQKAKKDLEKKLKEKGFELNEKKTKITPLTKKFTFLGFDFRLTETGKVIMTISSKKLKAEKRLLRKFAKDVKAGKRTKESVDAHFAGYLNHAKRGNSYRAIQNLIKFYNDLWR